MNVKNNDGKFQLIDNISNRVVYKGKINSQKTDIGNFETIDFSDFKKYLNDFKVNEIIFPQSEYDRLEPVISGLGISPVNIKGLLVISLHSTVAVVCKHDLV